MNFKKEAVKIVIFFTIVLAGLWWQAGNGCADEFGLLPVKGFSSSDQGGDKSSVGVIVGATTVDGKNYQQIGVRADIPVGKLGIGINAQLLLDENGKVRKEDWNEAKDYLDMIYYLRWDHKGAPFYAKVGALDFTYLGYSNIVNGYSNTIEYPDYKRLGMEMSFRDDKLSGELLLNDFKELSSDKPSVVVGTRLGYKVLSKLEIGATVVSDINQYNGLRDSDGDGYPDSIDKYPHDSSLVTELDYLRNIGLATETIDDMRLHGLVDSIERGALTDYSKLRSQVTVYGLDAGIPIIEGEFLKMDVYSSFSKIANYGWGITVPGVRAMFGNLITLTAEYRTQSDRFLFGYFNQTYDLERSQVINEGGVLKVRTKEDTLNDIKDNMNGYLAGVSVNIFKYLRAGVQFQDMSGGQNEKKSLAGEVVLNDNAISYLPSVKGYYAQNNVDKLTDWRTPSTVMGLVVKLNMGNTTLAVDSQYTFMDRNGDGKIDGSNETIKTIGVSSTVTF